MTTEKFNVHITFSNGDSFVERDKDIEATRSAIARLIHGPAARGGLIKEFRVVDVNDFPVFHHADGVTRFPPARKAS